MTSYLPSWESVTKAVSSIYSVARDINPATLTGAIDVIVVQRHDGTLACSPFHVRFGKLKLLVPSEKAVEVIVNGVRQNLPMKVGDAGEAFFVVETAHPVPKEYATSPVPLPSTSEILVEPLVLDAAIHALQTGRADLGSPSSPNITPSTAPTDPFPNDDVPEPDSAETPLVRPPVDPSVEHLFKVDDVEEDEDQSTLALSADQNSERSRYPVSDTEMDRKRNGLRPHTTLSMLSDTEAEPIVGSPPEKNWSWTWGALPTKATAASIAPTDEDQTGTPPDDAPSTPASPLSPAPSSPTSAGVRSDFFPDHALLPGAATIVDDDFPLLGDFRVDMSLCGQPDNLPKLSKEEAVLLFRKNAISFDDFCQNPHVLTDPNLVLRINDNYYSWSVAAPMIACRAIYGCDLPKDVLGDLVGQHQKKTAVSGWRGWWSRSSTTPAAATAPVPVPLPISASSPKVMDKIAESPPMSPPVSAPPSPSSVASTRGPKEETPEEHNYAKTLRLTSDQLQSLNLQKGMNSVSFVVRSSLQGTATTNARIFLLDQDTKIVISDVDGTITKSDALGHLFTMVGRDWTHLGVAGLYTAIQRNGYQMMYLTSRAIGQASYTRDYLKKVEQGRFQLPDGPVIMSPDRLFKSFHREVILKKPEEFKMAVLRDIKRLFGDTTPFYAGFGNRITDALSYRSVGIPPSRIFTIDPAGDVKLELMPSYKSDYLSLNELAEYLFPPLKGGFKKSEDEAYSDLNFWRQPLPDIDAILDIGEGNDDDYDEEEEDMEGSGVDMV